MKPVFGIEILPQVKAGPSEFPSSVKTSLQKMIHETSQCWSRNVTPRSFTAALRAVETGGDIWFVKKHHKA